MSRNGLSQSGGGDESGEELHVSVDRAVASKVSMRLLASYLASL